MAQAITPNQLRRLQTLYGQFAAHGIGEGGREARLKWASEQARRPIASFRDLRSEEARLLTDTLQDQLGVKHPVKRRRRLGRDDAKKAGTEGRRGNETNDVTLAGPGELARIQYALDEIGWSQEQLEGWLRSPRSPLSNKAQPKIRTLGEANRVWWALKHMMDAKKRQR